MLASITYMCGVCHLRWSIGLKGSENDFFLSFVSTATDLYVRDPQQKCLSEELIPTYINLTSPLLSAFNYFSSVVVL